MKLQADNAPWDGRIASERISEQYGADVVRIFALHGAP